MMTFWQRPPDLHYREIRRRVEEKLKAAYSRLPLPQTELPTIVLVSDVKVGGSIPPLTTKICEFSVSRRQTR